MVPTALRSGPSLTLGVLKEPPKVSWTRTAAIGLLPMFPGLLG